MFKWLFMFKLFESFGKEDGGVSSEHRILTVSEMLPSSSVDDTAQTFVASGLFMQKEGGVL